MNRETVEEIIKQAIANMYGSQPNIDGFIPAETGQTEWNLAHHLAIELNDLLPWFDCDVDVTKHEYGNMRPDIILHRRGTDDHNFLVVETKYGKGAQAIEDDLEKIRNEWFTGNLNYRFGASINLWNAHRDPDITVLQNH